MAFLKLALLALVCSALGWSQFSELATTDDGQELYFTSQLRLSADSATRPEYRVFHVSSKGIALFADRAGIAAEGFISNSGVVAPASPFFVSVDGVSSPEVSGDGSLVGVTAHHICVGTPCTPVQAEGFLRGSRSADLGPGRLQLARNGRWAVLTQGVVAGIPSSVAKLIDLQTMQTRSIPAPATARWSVASTGAVLVQQPPCCGGGGLGIWQ